MRDFTDLTNKELNELASVYFEREYSEYNQKTDAFNERLAHLCIEYMTGRKTIRDLQAYLDLERETAAKDEFVFQENG